MPGQEDRHCHTPRPEGIREGTWSWNLMSLWFYGCYEKKAVRQEP